MSDEPRWPQGDRFVIHRVYQGSATVGSYRWAIFDRAYCHRLVCVRRRHHPPGLLERLCADLNRGGVV